MTITAGTVATPMQPSHPEETSRFSNTVALGTERIAVPRARHHVRAVLYAWGLGRYAEEAELITSELVSNALQSVWGANLILPVLMHLRADSEILVIEIWDNTPIEPAIRPHLIDSEHGRGLEIVSHVADSWGFYPAHNGKVVWALLKVAE